jgi:hypothetical protein
MKIGFTMTTATVLEAFRPTQPQPVFLTGFLGTKLFFEIAHIEIFLLQDKGKF